MLERAAVTLIRFYRAAISPLTPAACRYQPTCSEYALRAVESHGPVRGLWLATRRILRCHPFGGRGWDPVPSAGPPESVPDGPAPADDADRAPAADSIISVDRAPPSHGQ